MFMAGPEVMKKPGEVEVVAPPAIDLTQLRARRTEMRETAGTGYTAQQTNAAQVVAAAFEMLKPVIPKDSGLKTLLG